jgi:hypothetical protein
MHEAFTLPAALGKQLVSQVKSLAKLLPVARPQEGKFKIEKDGDVTHVRVHALPAQDGERLHLRLANAKAGAKGYTLESLGLHGEALQKVEEALARGRGLILIEGQGKTTLLHTLYDLVLSPHKVVVWADSAQSLRAALRHDPDAVFVDDVSDPAVVALATEAAGRGVLVAAAAKRGAEGLFSPTSGHNGDVSENNPSATRLTMRLSLVRRLSNGQFRHMQRLSRTETAALEEYADFAAVYDALRQEDVIDSGVAWKDVQFAHPTPDTSSPQGYEGYLGLQEVSDAWGRAGLGLVEDGLFKAAQGVTSLEEVLGLLNKA